MIDLLPSPYKHSIGFKLTGRLHDDDYQEFVPKVDEAIGEGVNHLLAWFHDFKGWDLHALWDDSKFAAKHATKLQKIALVGESKWEERMATACKPFTKAKLRYFPSSDIDAAWEWLDE